MSYKVLVVAALAAVAVAEKVPHDHYVPPSPHHPGPSYHEPDYHKVPPKYDFHYTVKDKHNDYGHWESRNGDHTEGKYFVVLPDTRKQNVEYFVDGKSGYVAKVTYEGKAVFPKPKPYKPVHKPDPYVPPPVYTPKPKY